MVLLDQICYESFSVKTTYLQDEPNRDVGVKCGHTTVDKIRNKNTRQTSEGGTCVYKLKEGLLILDIFYSDLLKLLSTRVIPNKTFR